MKQKKIRRGVIPEDVLNEVHLPENFIDINLRTDIRVIRDNLKRKRELKKAKKSYLFFNLLLNNISLYFHVEEIFKYIVE